jgi:spore coat protein U-like protein
MKRLMSVVNYLRLAALMIGILMFAKPGFSATATANLTVTAQVEATCTVTTTTLAFGSYDPTSANVSSPLDGTATVAVTCTSGTSATIGLGQGLYAAGGSTDLVPLRRLFNGATGYLSYYLYEDASRAVAWGSAGPVVIGTGVQDSHTVYGRISAGQTSAPAGSYSDTVVATVTY